MCDIFSFCSIISGTRTRPGTRVLAVIRTRNPGLRKSHYPLNTNLNHLFFELEPNRTFKCQTQVEPNIKGRTSNRTELFLKVELTIYKNPFPGEKIWIKFFANKLFASKKIFVEKNHNISFFWQYFCPKKFANFLSNFELLRTSNLRYKNANFRTRTKFECISTLI